ncbi:protein POOR HOMOLOGOUS SYNAPSIS 1 [Iris pallida]|uniref:Protein POOR HOMOLOGOUS SYNAPSIS 1 n=1 Tax=Iris pallida TaxID=29817 RepID=A0AAX6E7P8_IRIPA|nr:protein POOR HOMOLOGOUS SYNAPSIS 1 [Iris pallida]
MDIAPLGCDIVCENSPSSEFMLIYFLLHWFFVFDRFDDESRYEQPISTCAPEVPALTYSIDQPETPLQPLLATNIDTIFSGLPPSFTELLNNCSTDTKKEQCTAGVETNSTSQNEGDLQNPPFHNATELPGLTEEVDLKTQIVKCMSDASFHDMLFKIEKVIDELGGDLSL